MQGLKISKDLTISYRLFTDDLGIFLLATPKAFQQVRKAIQTYESAFGSKLNLRKTTVIPFNLPSIPPWLIQTGCTISKSTTLHKYLGAPWGANLPPGQLHNFCLQNIASRLSSWSAQYLSFAGRVLLIKHVFQEIPIYPFLFIRIPTKTIKKLNCTFKDFLWGFQPTGGRKVPLIAWESLYKPKALGGQGFKNPYHPFPCTLKQVGSVNAR